MAWGPLGVYGGGLLQAMDISAGKMFGGTDTQGFNYCDNTPASGLYGDNWVARNPGLGASGNYNQIAAVLASTLHPGTTVAAGSNGGNIANIATWGTPGAGVLAVASTTGYAASGSVSVATSGGNAVIAYTGITGNTLTGCTLVYGSGTVSTGGTVSGTTYIATGDGLLKTTTDGCSWTPLATSVVFAANGANSADPIPSLNWARPVGRLLLEDSAGATQFLWAATYKQGIKRSTDGGVTFPVVANMAGVAPGTNYFARTIAQDPDQTTTCYAGFIDHSSGTTGFGGIWRCTNAHTTTSAPNFIRLAGLNVAAVEDIKVLGGIIYAACGTDGVFMADKTADLSNAANWVNIGTIGGTGTGIVLNAASIWMSLDVVVDSGNHLVAVTCSQPADTAKTCAVKIVVNPTAKTVTSRSMLANNTNVSTSTLPPVGQTWWNSGSGLVLGASNFRNPQVMWDPADATHNRIYICADQGLYRTSNGGTTWTIACAGMRMFLGRDMCTDPNTAGWGAVCSSDWLVVFWKDGVAANASTTAQSGSGLPGSSQGFAVAVDPVDSTVYLAVGNKYGKAPTAGQIYQGAGGATFPPGPFTTVGPGAGDWGTAVSNKTPIGLCALRDGSNNKVLLAAAWQGGGLWRNVQAAGAWTAWTQVGAATSVATSTGATGFNIRFQVGPGGTGNPPVIYCYDPKTGIYRSLDYGLTWATVISTITSGTAGSAEIAAHPVNVGELWVTANYNMRKLTNAHGTGTLGNTLISTLGNPGALAIRPTDAAMFATTRDTGSGQTAVKSTDGGLTWPLAVPGDVLFGQLDNTSEHIRFDQGGVSGRVYVSGSNIVTQALFGAGAGGSFTLVQQSNNIVGAAGSFSAWFSATSVGSTLNNLLSVRLLMDDCAMTVTAPNANWELVADGPSGTASGFARAQTWLYRRCAAGIGALVGSAAVFTYSNTGATVKGRIHEHSSAAAFQYVDRTGVASAQVSSATPGPVTGGAAARVTGGLALTATAVVHSNVPTGQSWGTPGGWTTDGSTPNAALIFHLMEQAVPGGTETFTDSLTLGTGVMTSWAETLVTLWCSAVQVTTASLPGGNQGTAYSQALAAAGTTGAVTWSLWSGALPPGLAISGANITGTPTAAGTFTFRVLATDTAGAMGYSALFSVTIAAGVTITTSSPLPDGAVGDAFSLTLALTGGSPAYTWTRPSGTLPTGLSLSTAGVISGTPSVTGPFTFDVLVTDGNGSTDRTTLAITIRPAVLVTTTTVPHAIAGVAYSAALGADGGLPAYSWAITSGALPAGTALDPVAGIIAGSAATPGSYPFTAQVTDAGGSTAAQALILVVDSPPAPGAVSDSLVVAGQFELAGDGVVSDHPACPGAIFRLGRAGGSLDYDLGMPQPVTDLLASLALDGERPMGRRASNRTMVLPVVIVVPPSGDAVADRSLLAAARETLWQAIDGDRWELTWARAGGQPVVFDCFRAAATTYHYSLIRDKQLVSVMDLTFQALPYGRSTDLETLAFAAPSASWQMPADPITIDDFTTVASATNAGQWSRSTQAAVGAFSAHWSRRWRDRPNYTHGLAAPVGMGTRPKVSFWVGLGTSADQYHVWHGGKVTADVQLTDTSGTTIQMAATVTCACSGLPGQPAWTRVSVAMPLTTLFDNTAVASYSIKLWNTTDNDTGNRILQAECYISGLEASAAAVGAPAGRGAVYQLRGVIGTARAPLNIQVQPGPTVQKQVHQRDASGASAFLVPAGVTVGMAEVWAGGNGGGGGAGSGLGIGGGGGPGGEYACEPAMPFTPGANVTVIVGGGGGGGAIGANGQPGGMSQITSTGMTVTASPGNDGGFSGQHVGFVLPQGGTGSQATIHYDGGAGALQEAAGQAHSNGSGGGGSGGQFQAGRPGSRGTGTGPGPGATAVPGGGPGGNGAHDGRAGSPPASGPGGGGGGGDSLGAGGPGSVGRARITYGVTVGIPLKSLLLHRAGPNAPGTLQPLVSVFGTGTDVPDGSIEYPVVSYAPGVQPKFSGTYTVVAVAQSWHGAVGTTRTLTVQVKQYDGASGSPPATGTGRVSINSVARTFAPQDAPNGLVVLGDITLPVRGVAPDQADATFTLTVNSTDTADLFYDVMLLDTEGSTILLNGTAAGYANLFVDAPDADRALGPVLGSYTDRDAASSVLDDTIVSGPPLSVDPGDNWLLAYSPQGVPAMFATYLPRWWLDRLR